VYQWFFLLQKWTKEQTNFFFDSEFDSERASGIISNTDSNQKLRNFLVVYTPLYPMLIVLETLEA
jgi:hypothetical protein